MTANMGYETPGIAGSGAIATGLAAVSTTTADTILLARSEASAWRAEEKVVAACAKIEGAEPSRLRVTTDPKDLSDCDVVIEAIVEEVAPKAELLRAVAEACPNADLGTTTSSLSIGEIANAAGTPQLFGFHVSRAIGDALYAESNEPNHKPPELMVKMEQEGKLGRKSGAGFYSYD